MAFESQPHELGLSVEHPAPGVSVVRPVGEIDMLTAPELAKAFRDELTTACRVLVVDLEGVEFLGSSGLAALVEARQFASKAATVRLAGAMRPIVARGLQVSRLDHVFGWYPSVDEAVAAVDARAG
jgi:anti-sigma B factor antagonist